MSRPPVDMRGWRSGDGDDIDPRLLWPDAWRFTPDQVARLLSLRSRVRCGAVREDTPDTRRLLFIRRMVERGLYGR